MSVMFLGVGIARYLPISMSQQLISQYPRIPEREREPLSPGWIAGRGGISDQHDPLSVRVIDPGIGTIKGGERPRHLPSRVPLSGRTTADRLLNESREIRFSL